MSFGQAAFLSVECAQGVACASSANDRDASVAGSADQAALFQPGQSSLDGALGELDISGEFQNARSFQAAYGRVDAQVVIGEQNGVGQGFHSGWDG